MKISITTTLIITIAVFAFVSGYSIGSHNKQGPNLIMASQTNVDSIRTATAAEHSSTASGGYGSPSSEKTTGSSPGYGAPSPGYGQ